MGVGKKNVFRLAGKSGGRIKYERPILLAIEKQSANYRIGKSN